MLSLSVSTPEYLNFPRKYDRVFLAKEFICHMGIGNFFMLALHFHNLWPCEAARKNLAEKSLCDLLAFLISTQTCHNLKRRHCQRRLGGKKLFQVTIECNYKPCSALPCFLPTFEQGCHAFTWLKHSLNGATQAEERRSNFLNGLFFKARGKNSFFTVANGQT